MNVVIIIGSARNDGYTHKVARELVKISGWDMIDLLDYDISHYDYQHRNKDDDFLPLMRRITEDYDILIMATPVYWYAMSGIMKVFFDRLTDLLTIDKNLGRKLRGKSLAAISCSNGGNLGDEFWLPFMKSAEYLGMNYLTNLHTYEGNPNKKELANFCKNIEKK